MAIFEGRRLQPCWIGTLAAIALAFAGAPVAATTVIPKDFTCPVGGEKFTANVIGSYTSWGQRPDGREFGTLPIYPIVECPRNGLLLVEETFTPEDVATLTPLVASDEYQAMRKSETPHYRAWWLLSKLQRDPYRKAGFLLQASWETDADLARKARYQAAFIAAATALKLTSEHSREWFFLNLRAANALRELGYFDKAVEVMARVDKPELLPQPPAEADGIRHFMAGLKALIAENNPAPEPANLIPMFEAARRCEVGAALLSPIEVTACGNPELAKPRAEIRKALDKEQKKRAKGR